MPKRRSDVAGSGRADGPADPEGLPSALGAFARIAARLRGRRAAVFVDFDGTLTPIVERPGLAVLDDAMRERLRRLAARCPVAVISGRGLDDIRARVGLDALHYAGSHGFEIGGPGGWTKSYGPAAAAPEAVRAAAAELERALAAIDGAIVEPKAFAVAVHYRMAAPDDVARVEAAVDAALGRHPELRKAGGKKVFELRPAADWDKGRAVRWLIEAMGLSGAGVVPIYIGDDLTDEDALRALKGTGIGVAVRDAARGTAADYTLADTDEVGRFLDRLAEAIGG